MPPRCAACPADMYADHSLRLAQEVIAENFFLCLLRQKGKGSGKFRMVQNGGLAAGGKKVFFKLFRLGKLDKLLIHQIVKGNFRKRTIASTCSYASFSAIIVSHDTESKKLST